MTATGVSYFPDGYWADVCVSSSDGIAAPTVAIADNEDGMGATATVTEATQGTTNTIYTQPLTGDLGVGEWSSAGSRSSNGAVALDLDPGIYRGYCLSELSGNSRASEVIDFIVTTGTSSIYSQILDAVQARLRLLQLAGLESANVVVREVPLERLLPDELGQLTGNAGIVIAPQRDTFDPRAGVTTHDDLVYGVWVCFFASSNQDRTGAKIPGVTLWRERVSKAFRNQRLPGVSGVFNSGVESSDVFPYQAWVSNRTISSLLLKFTSRESRGLT